MRTHAVIYAPAGKNNFRMIADLLCAVREVIGIDANAVATDKPRLELKEIPLCGGSRQNFVRIEAEFVKEDSEFIYQRDVDVPLRILDYLRCFRHLDRSSLVSARFYYRGVQRVNGLGRLWRRTARNFWDGGHPMELVPGIYAFGTISNIKLRAVRSKTSAAVACPSPLRYLLEGMAGRSFVLMRLIISLRRVA